MKPVKRMSRKASKASAARTFTDRRRVENANKRNADYDKLLGTKTPKEGLPEYSKDLKKGVARKAAKAEKALAESRATSNDKKGIRLAKKAYTKSGTRPF